MARDLSFTDAYVTSRRERKKVEMLFAHLKRILKLDRRDYAGQRAPAMSSTSPPQTSVNSPSSTHCQAPRSLPDRGAQPTASAGCAATPPDFFNTIHRFQPFA
jgi:hypothetical protein